MAARRDAARREAGASEKGPELSGLAAKSKVRFRDWLKTDELVPYARNARTHSDVQIGQIADSIREWGWTNPVLVDENKGIVAGHGRVMAATRLGEAWVPVIVLSGLTEAQRRAYVIADNKIALNAGWDEEMLRAELQDLGVSEFDMDLLGFSPDEMSLLFGQETSVSGRTHQDAVPDVKPAVSQAGDIWQLGLHRVGCGDSTNAADVQAVVGAGQADACWTDPPYNVNYEGSDGKRKKIANDSMTDAKFRAFLRAAFSAAAAVLKPGAAMYVAHADTEGINFRSAFLESGFKLSGCLVWVKDSLVLGRSDYQWQHEPILYGWKAGGSHRWFGGRRKTTVQALADGGAFVMNDDGSVTVTIGQERVVLRGENLTATPLESTVIRCEKPKRSADHPTMKPVALVQGMLRNSTREGDVVLDVFGGSGTTLIACETLGRQARLVELDPQYVDVIVRRWQEFTGQEARLIDDNRTFAQVVADRLPREDRQPAEATS